MVNYILSEKHGKKIAVIENEFGEVLLLVSLRSEKGVVDRWCNAGQYRHELGRRKLERERRCDFNGQWLRVLHCERRSRSRFQNPFTGCEAVCFLCNRDTYSVVDHTIIAACGTQT